MAIARHGCDFFKRTVEEFICRGYSPNQMSSNPVLISLGYIKQKQKVWMLEQISLDLTEIRLHKESGVHKLPSTRASNDALWVVIEGQSETSLYNRAGEKIQQPLHCEAVLEGILFAVRSYLSIKCFAVP